MEYYDELANIFPRMYSANSAERSAVVAYLVGMYEYDLGVGILLEHLTYDDPVSGKLLDRTALVLASDHFNTTTYGHDMNTAGGGLLAQNPPYQEYPVGEKIAFMIYNPRDVNVVDYDITNPIPFDVADLSLWQVLGRKIEAFMVNNDIYKTICHLFNIQTHNNFTLGNSLLALIPEFVNQYTPDKISVGIAFSNGMFMGMSGDSVSAANGFTTYNLKNFAGVMPNKETSDAVRERLIQYAGTLLKLRSSYDGNDLKSTEANDYAIGVRH